MAHPEPSEPTDCAKALVEMTDNPAAPVIESRLHHIDIPGKVAITPSPPGFFDCAINDLEHFTFESSPILLYLREAAMVEWGQSAQPADITQLIRDVARST